MKFINLYIIIVIIFFFLSCKKDDSIVAGNQAGKGSTKINLSVWNPYPQNPIINCGFFAVTYNTDLSSMINSFSKQGWNGVILDDYFQEGGKRNYAAAHSAGYSPILVSMSYKYAGSDWGLATWEINYAKALGATWVYLDDALTNYYNHPGNPDFPYISDSRMDSLCDFVRSLDMKMAVSEGCEVMRKGQLIIDSNRIHFYDKVDFLMPYGYDCSMSDLGDFHLFIKNQLHKDMIPILRNDQKGWRSGNLAYIELASMYAYNKMVFYWPVGNDPSNLAGINQYLHTYNYMIGAPQQQ
jgi:hypothetical protein